MAKDSGVPVIAKNDGVVEDVDASRIIIRSSSGNDHDEDEVEIHKLIKYKKIFCYRIAGYHRCQDVARFAM